MFAGKLASLPACVRTCVCVPFVSFSCICVLFLKVFPNFPGLFFFLASRIPQPRLSQRRIDTVSTQQRILGAKNVNANATAAAPEIVLTLALFFFCYFFLFDFFPPSHHPFNFICL